MKNRAVVKFRITVKGKAGGTKGEAKYSLKLRGLDKYVADPRGSGCDLRAARCAYYCCHR